MVTNLGDDLQYHKKELQILRSEKESLETVLNTKTGDVRKTLTHELRKVEDEMKRHYSH
jgi:chromosome segregation ATPase